MQHLKLGKAELPISYFLDLDGTIFKHQGTLSKMLTNLPVLLPNVVETIDKMIAAGHVIILTTGRPETSRKITEEQLAKFGICYSQLVMSVGIGARVIVNDLRPNDPDPTASAINLPRDVGISEMWHVPQSEIS